MLGLMATLTPILYKHISNRKEDISNINEANTLLLIKDATKEYIEANKDHISIGTYVIDPTDVGIDISGYSIGIRKDSDGNISAMIASNTPGNDLSAAKVASLLGVSAGIYSSQDLSRAWGINGVWAEDIANYGFSSLPTGIPVVTTAYDKEDTANIGEALNIEEIISSLEGKTITPGKICLKDSSYPNGEYCVQKWEDIAELDKFKDAMKEGETCQNHSDCGSSGNLLCLKPSGQTTGSCQNPIDVILKCTQGNNLMCANGYDAALNRNCDQIRKAYTTVSQDPPLDQPVTHRLSTSSSGGYITATCYFPSGDYANNNKMGYTNLKGTTAGNVGLLDACNGSDPFACRTALRNDMGLYWCDDWKKYGYTNGNYKLFHTQAWTGTEKSSCHMSSPSYSSLMKSSSDNYTYTIPFDGNYYMFVQGQNGGSPWWSTVYGGKVSATQTFTVGTKIIVGVAYGGQGSGTAVNWRCYTGSNGYGLYIGTRTEKNLALVAGGGGIYYDLAYDVVPCAAGGWLTSTGVNSSGCCSTTIRPAGRFGSVGTPPTNGQNAVAGTGNAGGNKGNGAGGCPSIYSPYPSLVSNCNYTSPTAVYGTGTGVFLYAIGIPSGFTPPPIP